MTVNTGDFLGQVFLFLNRLIRNSFKTDLSKTEHWKFFTLHFLDRFPRLNSITTEAYI